LARLGSAEGGVLLLWLSNPKRDNSSDTSKSNVSSAPANAGERFGSSANAFLTEAIACTISLVLSVKPASAATWDQM